MTPEERAEKVAEIRRTLAIQAPDFITQSEKVLLDELDWVTAERKRNAEFEAQAAAMREALERAELWLMERHQDHQDEGLGIIQSALRATDAGKALLERLRRAEDLADGDLVHARLAQLRERAEKAERELAEYEARVDAESAQAQEDRWNQALGKAAKEVESMRDPLKQGLVIQDDAVERIRALKTGGGT